MITYTSNYIEIQNEYISKIFTSKELMSMSIEGQKNCCTPLPYTKFNLEFNQDCKYIASYQNYEEQSTCGAKVDINCLESPISSYYKNVSELYIYIDGKSTNIISQSYNMTSTTDVQLLKDKINSYFAGKNMSPLVEVNVTYTSDNFLKTEIIISELPTNVLFERFILANDETCYVNSIADCDLGIRCNVNKFTLPVGAIVTSFIMEDNTYFPSSGIIPGNIDTTSLGLLELLGDTNYSIAYVGNDLYFYGVESPISYIKYTYAGNTITAFPTCMGYEEEIPQCVYSVKIPTTGYINSFVGYNDAESFTSPVFADSVTINTATLSDDINTLLLAGTAVVTLAEDLIVISFSDIDFIPAKMEVDGENYYFQCDQLTYFQNIYDPEQIEFTSNGVRLKSGYLGSLTNGVYNLKVTTETDAQVITDSYCLFVDLDLKCKIAKLTDLDKLEEAILLYEALTVIHECMDCECENACILYQELNNILMSYNLVDNDCNC